MKNSLPKSMNNTKAGRLQNERFSKKANAGRTSSNKIRETVLYSLECSLESNYSQETAKKIKNSLPKSMNNTKAKRLQNVTGQRRTLFNVLTLVTARYFFH